MVAGAEKRDSQEHTRRPNDSGSCRFAWSEQPSPMSCGVSLRGWKALRIYTWVGQHRQVSLARLVRDLAGLVPQTKLETFTGRGRAEWKIRRCCASWPH